MKPSSASTEPNSSSLLSASVELSLRSPGSSAGTSSPWPPKLSAVTLEQVGQRAVLVGAAGAEGHVEAVEALVDLVELERQGGLLDGQLGAVGEHLAVPGRPA